MHSQPSHIETIRLGTAIDKCGVILWLNPGFRIKYFRVAKTFYENEGFKLKTSMILSFIMYLGLKMAGTCDAILFPRFVWGKNPGLELNQRQLVVVY